MDCRGFKRNMDEYLRRNLPGTVQEDFEAHYFSCRKCFDRLRIRHALVEHNFALHAMENVPVAAGPRRKVLAMIAASLVVVVGVGLFTAQWRHRHYLERISRFDPPLFVISETRSPRSDPVFNAAVAVYREGDYARALKILEGIQKEDRTPKTRFLAGICRLLVGDARGAEDDFDAIIREMNPSYFDEALYYKGIALLRQDEVTNARRLFSRLSEMFSPLQNQARVRLALIASAR